MLATNSNTRVPIIYYVDDFEDTLAVARSYFKHKNVIFREVHNIAHALKMTSGRQPSLVVISAALGDPYRWGARAGFQVVNVLHTMCKGVKMVTIAHNVRQDDMIDSQREGALEHHDFSIVALERILQLARQYAEADGTCGDEAELTSDERIITENNQANQPAAMQTPAEALTDMASLRNMIYGVVRQAVEDILLGRKTPPLPSATTQQSTEVHSYRFN